MWNFLKGLLHRIPLDFRMQEKEEVSEDTISLKIRRQFYWFQILQSLSGLYQCNNYPEIKRDHKKGIEEVRENSMEWEHLSYMHTRLRWWQKQDLIVPVMTRNMWQVTIRILLQQNRQLDKQGRIGILLISWNKGGMLS